AAGRDVGSPPSQISDQVSALCAREVISAHEVHAGEGPQSGGGVDRHVTHWPPAHAPAQRWPEHDRQLDHGQRRSEGGGGGESGVVLLLDDDAAGDVHLDGDEEGRRWRCCGQRVVRDGSEAEVECAKIKDQAPPPRSLCPLAHSQ
ncbi:hypothetical protein PMAYCL1PPCAC_13875, partial [Pristionchus mayeri]